MIVNTVETENKMQRKYDIVIQVAFVMFFMWSFFITARTSALYAGWNSQVQNTAVTGLVIFSVLLAGFTIWALFMATKLGKWKNRWHDIMVYGAIIVFAYIIRAGMIGSVQKEEGAVCYEYIKNLAIDPSPLFGNFLEAGRMAGRISHGYTFWALIGEFMTPGTGTGFQWMHVYFAMGAGCCMYAILIKLFPKIKKINAWLAAFVIMLQPMFLGFSMMCSIEYGLTVFFIFAYYCYLYRKYVLMVFWLVMMAGCKSIGLIIALAFLFSVFMAKYLKDFLKIKDSNNVDDSEIENEESEINYFNLVVMCIVALTGFIFFGVLYRICVTNGINIDFYHVKLKLAQLYILNFSWIWLIVVIVGIIMVIANKRVKRTNPIAFKPLFVFGMVYVVHTAYLLFYPKSSLPRYDMLSDIMLPMMGVFLLIKMFERRRAFISITAIMGVLMCAEAFVTIDPVTVSTFRTIETGSFPMVYTAAFESDTGEESYLGDFSFYNYHYTVFFKPEMGKGTGEK